MNKFKISGTHGNYRFNLYAKNNKIIGRGSEGYKTKSNCIIGITSVKQNTNAKVSDLTKGETYTGARYEIFYSSERYWFRLRAANGETILASQSYATKESCINGINSVKENAPTAAIEEEIL